MTKTSLSDLEREKFDEARLYTANQHKIQKQLFRKGLKKIGKVISIVALSAAAAGTIDYFLLDTNVTNKMLTKVVSGVEYLIKPEDGLPRIFEGLYIKRLISTGIAAIALSTLGILGVNSAVTNKYKKKNNIAEAVLGVPHHDRNSEAELYQSLTGNSGRRWDKERRNYFITLSEWAKIEKFGECLKDNNYHFGDKIPEEALEKKLYRRPSLEEIVVGLGKRDDRKPMELPKKKGIRIAFALPKQPNQPQQYFEGYIFDALGTQEFLGYETVIKKLSSGEWVIGTCSPEEVKPTSISAGKKAKILEKLIQEEALKPLYYCVASEEAISIAFVFEGTYPVERGGVSSLVNEMMKELIPEYFNNRPVHFEIISHLAFTGPFKTKISYDLPKNVHVNPPIIMYGHTINPSIETKKDLPNNGELFNSSKKGILLSKGMRRHNEIKETISLLEKAIDSCDIELFYKVADRIQYFSSDELLLSSATMEYLYEEYHKTDIKDKPDFRRYQYQWRNLRQPLIDVIKSEKVPADVYYSLATGVSGVYSALAKKHFNCGLVLTEHGIYKEDRIVDIANSPLQGFFANKWEKTLDFYSRLVYDAAYSITTTCMSNYFKQMKDGAPKEKLKLIPGAIHTDGKSPQNNDPGLKDPNSFTVGMLGNVQRVKRVELFINTAGYLMQKYSQINWTFKVMGRDDQHDKRYVDQIHTMVDTNPVLSKSLKFSPYTNFKEAFSPLDAGVLMSSSEVQPLSIMEFLSLGKPMIGLDVGGIDELINGTNVDQYGPAGLVVGVGTTGDVVKRVADSILILYLRKHYLLTGKHSSIPNPDSDRLSWLLEQRIPIEVIGPKRMAETYDMKKIMPKYAREYLDSIPLTTKGRA